MNVVFYTFPIYQKQSRKYKKLNFSTLRNSYLHIYGNMVFGKWTIYNCKIMCCVAPTTFHGNGVKVNQIKQILSKQFDFEEDMSVKYGIWVRFGVWGKNCVRWGSGRGLRPEKINHISFE
jgi:hypothetical protein